MHCVCYSDLLTISNCDRKDLKRNAYNPGDGMYM